MKIPSKVYYVCPSCFSSRHFPSIATKSRSTADLSWSVLTSSGWFGTGNIRNVFSRPNPQTASFPLAYFCITPYFLPTMKPQTYKGRSRARRSGGGFDLAMQTAILWLSRSANLWKRKCGAVGIELYYFGIFVTICQEIKVNNIEQFCGRSFLTLNYSHVL